LRLTKISVLICLLLALAASAIAQEQQDSLIIGSVYLDCDQWTFIRVYAVTFDSICFLSASLHINSPENQIRWGTGTQYFPPMTSWDTIIDSLIYDENIMMTIAWADIGGDPNEPLFTNGQRQHIITYRVGIELDAQPQIACIDTVYSSRYGSAFLGRCDEQPSPPIAFIPGCIYYCQPNEIIESEGDDNKAMIPFNFTSYPNPSSTTFEVKLNLLQENQIEISAYDILGRKVITKPSQLYSSGSYNILLNDEYFHNCPPGVYLIKVSNGSYSEVKKVTLIR